MSKEKLIYKATCLINNKCYVGITTQGLKRRAWRHKSIKYSGTCIFKNAILKYGFENFKFEVIEKVSTEDALVEREKFWIKELKALHPNGYNFLEGIVSGYELSRPRMVPVFCIDTGEVFECMSKAAEKYNVPKHSIWSACSGRTDFAGGHRFEYLEVSKKQKADQKRLQRKEKAFKSMSLAKSKKVKCIETGEVFDSIRKASLYFNIDQSLIIRVCKKTNKTANGLTFSYV